MHATTIPFSYIFPRFPFGVRVYRGLGASFSWLSPHRPIYDSKHNALARVSNILLSIKHSKSMFGSTDLEIKHNKLCTIKRERNPHVRALFLGDLRFLANITSLFEISSYLRPSKSPPR